MLRSYAERFVADARGCLQRDQLTPRQQECLGLELLGLDVIVSEDMSCTALEVNSGPRQCPDEDEMQYSMYEIALGLERTHVDEGMRWLELRTTGEAAFASPCTGDVAAWAGVTRVIQPPAPRATADCMHAKSSGQLAATSAKPKPELESTPSRSRLEAHGSAVTRQVPSGLKAAVDEFVNSMPGFV